MLPFLSACAGEEAPPVRAEPFARPEGIVVIGAGASGLAVAGELAEGVVLEATDVAGGRARLAGGLMLFVETEEQAAANVIDTPAELLADWPALTGVAPTDATTLFLTDLPGVRDRLAGLGLSFQLQPPDPVTRRQRLHGLAGGGAALADALLAEVPAGVEIRYATPATGLLLEGGGVVGVRTDAGDIPAGTVVVATGGFVNRADLVARYVSWEEGTWGVGSDTFADGAALDWAEVHGLGTAELGAIGSNADVIGIAGEDGAPLAPGPGQLVWVWVDGTGARFVDESQGWSIGVAGLVDRRAPVWAITTREIVTEPFEEADRARLDAELVCAQDWTALATALAIDADGLADTVAAVARYRAGDEGDPLGRGRSSFPSLEGEPCAFPPGHLASKNFGGLAVRAEDGQVEDAAGEPVVGLYAVGEAAGMGAPGLGGPWGFDGSLSAVVWSGWRTGEAITGD